MIPHRSSATWRKGNWSTSCFTPLAATTSFYTTSITTTTSSSTIVDYKKYINNRDMRDADIRQKKNIKVEHKQKHRAHQPHRFRLRPLHRRAGINNNNSNIDSNKSTIHIQHQRSTTEQHQNTTLAEQHQIQRGHLQQRRNPNKADYNQGSLDISISKLEHISSSNIRDAIAKNRGVHQTSRCNKHPEHQRDQQTR